MGRIAELFEKKAIGTITDEELKELTQLQKEAKTLATEKDENSEGEEDNKEEEKKEDDKGEEATAEAEVDKLAQRFADGFTGAMGGFSNKLDKVLSAIESKADTTITTSQSKNNGYIFDQKLGKKIAVSELAEQKVALKDRKAAGKSVTEVSMKTVHFLQALAQKNVEKLQLLSEGTAADGGFLVPEEFANMIIEDVRDMNVMRQIARPPITISSDTFHLPNLASRPVAAWRNEKAVKSTSTANFGENVFTPYSLAVIVGLTNELVADASLGVGASIVNYVANLMSISINEKEEQAFWTGSGSGQPTGIDGGAYTLRSLSGGITDTTRADSLIRAYWRTPQGYRNRGVWVMNSATMEKVSTLKDSQNNYLLRRLGDSQAQPTLVGKQVWESNYLAGGVALFGSFADSYQIVDREGISVRVSDEATVAGNSAFERNLTYIRVEKRVDAEVVLQTALTKITSLGTP